MPSMMIPPAYPLHLGYVDNKQRQQTLAASFMSGALQNSAVEDCSKRNMFRRCGGHWCWSNAD